MKGIFLVLGGGVAFLCFVLFAWLFLRPTPSPQVSPSSGGTPVVTTESTPTDAAIASTRAAFRSSASPPPAPAEPVEIPAPNLETLRPERESLYQELLAETNTLLPEIQAALAPLQTSDPATLATAWSLANNWGIFLKGESTADQRVTNAVLRQELAALHRRVLVDSAQHELRALIGQDIPPEVLTRLENLGRTHLDNARVRKTAAAAVDPDRTAARKRAAAGEEPGESP